MNVFADSLFFLGLAGMVSVFPVALVFYRSVLLTLKAGHPQTWQELGSPSLVSNNTIRNNFLFRRFLKNGRYIGLHDNDLTNQCIRLRRIERIYMAFFALAAAGAAWRIIQT